MGRKKKPAPATAPVSVSLTPTMHTFFGTLVALDFEGNLVTLKLAGYPNVYDANINEVWPPPMFTEQHHAYLLGVTP